MAIIKLDSETADSLTDLYESNEPSFNPYLDHEANRQFLTLYSGKQRRNTALWLDYFTSSAFLDVAWEPAFTALLLQNVTQMEKEYPPAREFLSWLSAAYQFSATFSTLVSPDGQETKEYQFYVYDEAQFEGIDSILRIAVKGPLPKRPTGNALAVFTSFSEYHHLRNLASDGVWNEKAVRECSQIIRCYSLSRLTDTCTCQEKNDVERHPAGLRLLTHFFERQDLPENLYRLLWSQLHLKSATMGRTKLFYGRLRELVTEHLPEIDQEPEESFLQLKKAFSSLSAVCRQQKSGRTSTQQAKKAIDAFFAREDFQNALWNRLFVTETLLRLWIDEHRHPYFLRKIIRFYREHDTAPCAEQTILYAKQALELQVIHQQTAEDLASPANLSLSEDETDTCAKKGLTLAYRPFFRHWLNTGFYSACNPEIGIPLSSYLQYAFPYLPEWSRQFLDADKDGPAPKPKTLVFSDGKTEIEVRFHLRYIDFVRNGIPVYRPVLNWDWLVSLTDNDWFFYLLPITVSTYDHYKEAKAEIRRRLKSTAVPTQGQYCIAAGLAGHVCRLPIPDTQNQSQAESVSSLLPLEVYLEDSEKLYVCSWFEKEQELHFSEQTPTGRRLMADGIYTQIQDEEAAIALADELLKETVSPSGIHTALLHPLPKAVYADPDFLAVCHAPNCTGSQFPKELLGDAVTPEQLELLFTLFAEQKLKRLELSWPCDISQNQGYPPRRSLVFLKEPAGYACLYFDDDTARSYALLANPDQYRNCDSIEIEQIPFRQATLSNYNIHRNFFTIRRHLDTIFRQAGKAGGIHLQAAHLWSNAVSVMHGRHKYNLDKQLLGGFPIEWSHNRLTSRFYLYGYPAFLTYTENQGQSEFLPIGNINRDCVQQALLRFMQGSLTKLQMTWGSKEWQHHIVLLQEEGRFMLAYLSDSKQCAEFYVADEKTYLDVEEKKYPKTVFLNRTVPAYLVHSDRIRLRNGLELLLANIYNVSIITDVFGAFAFEKPGKPRPYEKIRAELITDRT